MGMARRNMKTNYSEITIRVTGSLKNQLVHLGIANRSSPADKHDTIGMAKTYWC